MPAVIATRSRACRISATARACAGPALVALAPACAPVRHARPRRAGTRYRWSAIDAIEFLGKRRNARGAGGDADTDGASALRTASWRVATAGPAHPGRGRSAHPSRRTGRPPAPPASRREAVPAPPRLSSRPTTQESPPPPPPPPPPSPPPPPPPSPEAARRAAEGCPRRGKRRGIAAMPSGPGRGRPGPYSGTPPPRPRTQPPPMPQGCTRWGRGWWWW